MILRYYSFQKSTILIYLMKKIVLSSISQTTNLFKRLLFSISQTTTLFKRVLLKKFQNGIIFKRVLFSISQTTTLLKRVLFSIFSKTTIFQKSSPQKSDSFPNNSTPKRVMSTPSRGLRPHALRVITGRAFMIAKKGRG